MVTGLSRAIAYILTVLLTLFLYPIKFFFWCLSKIGVVVCMISDWIVAHANTAIEKLWSDLKSSENQE